MTDAPAVRAAIFDAYGTLFDVHGPIKVAGEALGDKARAFSELWRQKQLEYTWLRSLMGRYADFAQVTAEALDFTFEAMGIEPAASREKLLTAYSGLAAYEDAKPCLAKIKAAKLKTGILSNGSPAMLAAATASAGLGEELDYVLSVDPVQIYKPSPKVYILAEEALGLPASEIAFVSANGWDCAGAAAFGFQVIHVARVAQARERLGVSPMATASDLGEAAKVILSFA